MRRSPKHARLVLLMRYLRELPQQEIAEALEIPIGTVKSRINYGLPSAPPLSDSSGDRQREVKGRARANGALDPDLPTMRLDDALGDRQA